MKQWKACRPESAQIKSLKGEDRVLQAIIKVLWYVCISWCVENQIYCREMQKDVKDSQGRRDVQN